MRVKPKAWRGGVVNVQWEEFMEMISSITREKKQSKNDETIKK
tara:strand:- start:429 stop:557 length:129 start_codon:yes stop_codon:yes gene_type:complete